jgi:hypothetical protein
VRAARIVTPASRGRFAGLSGSQQPYDAGMKTRTIAQGRGRILAALAAVSLAAGCSAEARKEVPPSGNGDGAHAPFEAEVLAAVKDYKTWDRVSDRARWAPIDCMMRPPGGAVMSDSEDGTTHGRKLYFLFAKDGEAYEWLGWSPAASGRASSPVGQVLVKESWTAKEIPKDEVPELPSTGRGLERVHPLEYAVTDDKAFMTGEKFGLFVMMKLDPKTPGTDEGWVYATTSPDGTEVVESGLIESCMNCHQTGTKDRLFGLPRAREETAARRPR